MFSLGFMFRHFRNYWLCLHAWCPVWIYFVACLMLLADNTTTDGNVLWDIFPKVFEHSQDSFYNKTIVTHFEWCANEGRTLVYYFIFLRSWGFQGIVSSCAGAECAPCWSSAVVCVVCSLTIFSRRCEETQTICLSPFVPALWRQLGVSWALAVSVENCWSIAQGFVLQVLYDHNNPEYIDCHVDSLICALHVINQVNVRNHWIGDKEITLLFRLEMHRSTLMFHHTPEWIIFSELETHTHIDISLQLYLSLEAMLPFK